MLFLCVMIFPSAISAQVRREGILQARVDSDEFLKKEDIIQIDYHDTIRSHYKIYNPKGILIYEGYLNMKLYNLDRILPKNTILFKKHEYTEGINVLYTPGLYFFSPQFTFADTSDLLLYDYNHLLHDSIFIEYKNNKIIKKTFSAIHKDKDGYYMRYQKK